MQRELSKGIWGGKVTEVEEEMMRWRREQKPKKEEILIDPESPKKYLPLNIITELIVRKKIK